VGPRLYRITAASGLKVLLDLLESFEQRYVWGTKLVCKMDDEGHLSAGEPTPWKIVHDIQKHCLKKG
jgi:hypothetical protein